MGRVKIFVDKNETVEEVEDSLFKALNIRTTGENHDSDSFDDPAMRDIAARMKAIHDKIYHEILQEIFVELDKDYSK